MRFLIVVLFSFFAFINEVTAADQSPQIIDGWQVEQGEEFKYNQRSIKSLKMIPQVAGHPIKLIKFRPKQIGFTLQEGRAITSYSLMKVQLKIVVDPLLMQQNYRPMRLPELGS